MKLVLLLSFGLSTPALAQSYGNPLDTTMTSTPVLDVENDHPMNDGWFGPEVRNNPNTPLHCGMVFDDRIRPRWIEPIAGANAQATALCARVYADAAFEARYFELLARRGVAVSDGSLRVMEERADALVSGDWLDRQPVALDMRGDRRSDGLVESAPPPTPAPPPPEDQLAPPPPDRETDEERRLRLERLEREAAERVTAPPESP